ncbi:DNA helicase/exodeoxyribonuclease V, subunit B [Tindallia magadiensis]|uniref:DNA helicase/exodeoxyribonuclease V, subunit B n=1 Tax=Tindallia magadiensis TaxID=69895 RepID=A0A1I3FAN3_9FIRM|nr:helicase-exonuclease AddAB subunit AddB [Tindallia magadiensis]SFI08239.1 DNA helicase/exodeoxyribonuclease V, subunit B [Tindallia magadiensis]
MFRIWYGTDIEEKVRIMVHEIQKNVKKDPWRKQIIIVPEQYTLEMEKQYLKHSQEKGMMRVEVLSFSRLAYRVFLETGGRNRVFIDDRGLHMLVRKTLREQQENLKVYPHMIGRKGFVESLVKEINECKQYEVTSEMLRQQSQLHKDNEYIAGKLHDIAIIYENVQEALEDYYLHKEDRIELFRKKFQDANHMKMADYWVEGFYSFTPNMKNALLTIGEEADNLNILAYGGDELTNQYSVLHKQINHMKNYFSSQGIEVIKEKVSYGESYDKKAKEIKHLKECFYKLPIDVFDSEPSSIELFSASNDEKELVWAALKIQDLVQEKGYRYRQIAILCPDMEQRKNSIRRVMKQHKIPIFMDDKVVLKNHPLMVFLIEGLRAIESGFSFQPMMTYIKTGYAGLEIDEMEEFENICMQLGMKGNKWKKEIANAYVKPYQEDAEIWRKKVMEPLEIVEAKMKQSITVEMKSKIIFEWMEALNVPDILEAQMSQAEERDAFDQKQVYAQLWNELMELMDQMVEMMGTLEVSLDEYIDILESGIESMEVGTIPSTLDQVFVGTIERSRLSDVKCVFFLSANDGVLPAGINEEALLLPVEKQKLEGSGCKMGASQEERELQEMFYIYLAMTKPSDLLFISYSLATEEGAARRPSVIIDRLKGLFPFLSVGDDLFATSENTKKEITRPENTFSSLTTEVRKLLDGEVIDPLWLDTYRWFYGNENWKKEVDRMLEGLDFENQCQPLDSAVSEKLFGNPLYSSVARLEKYRKCPFSHFVQYGLKPEERKEFEIKPVELGNFLHQAMDGFAKAIKDNHQDWRSIDLEECDRLMDPLMEDLLDTFRDGIFQSSYRYQHAGKRVKQLGKTAVKTIVAHIQKGLFEPLYHELSFGKEGTWPALIYYDKEKTLASLEGRIDRLDMFEKNGDYYYRIVDYKTGNKEMKIPEVFHGLQMQLPVYLQAVLDAQRKQMKGSHYPAGLFYYKMDDPMIELNTTKIEEIQKERVKQLKLNGFALQNQEIVGAMDQEMTDKSEVLPVSLKKDGSFSANSMVLELEEFDLLLQHTQQLVVRMAKNILSGDISIHPVEYDGVRVCQYCEFHSVCQFDQNMPDQQVNYMEPINKNEALEKIRKRLGKKVDSDA